jgi:purine-binding chemotaxis protein CheW
MSTSTTLHVICSVGGTDYALPANDVYQMESFTGATPVPGAPSYVIGLVQIRQQIIPVIDVRVRFGIEPIALTLESRVIVVKLKDRLVGILVDSAREVQNIAPEQFQVPPEIVAKQSSGFVKSIAQLKNRIIMLLDSEKVIGDGAVHA